MKLTKTAIDRARYEGSGTSRHVLWDDTLPGFGLRIYPTGKKSFVLLYRVQDRQRLMTVGAYGKLTLQQARDRARKMLANTIDGKDPLEERRKRQTEMMKDLWTRYLEQHAIPRKKPSSVEADRYNWERFIEPKLGRMKVDDITREHVTKIHHDLRKTPYQANRVLSLLSKMMTLAEKWGLRPDGSNPCRHVERYRERSRERYLADAELVRLAAALKKVEKTENESPFVIAALRLLVFTGARRGEILEMRWRDLDFERNLWVIPDSKTGAKVIPLTAPVREVLSTIPRIEGEPYVIQGTDPGTHWNDLEKPWQRIRKAAKLEEVRLHDLRHTYASHAAVGGASIQIIGKLLGHAETRTTEKYAHLGQNPVSEAADRVASCLASIRTAGWRQLETAGSGSPG